MVHWREHLSGLENRTRVFLTLDPWTAYAIFNFFLDTISCRIVFVAGSGKSVLWFVDPFMILSWLPTLSVSSTIIKDIAAMCQDKHASMAYFYFDFRDVNKQHLHDLIPSLLTQFSAHSHRHHDILSRLYKAHDNGKTQPSDLDLVNALKQMLLNLPSRRPVYLVMDALDECPDDPGIPSPRERVLLLVKKLVDLHLPNLHMCHEQAGNRHSRCP